MKKSFIAILIALVLCFTMVGCHPANNDTGNGNEGEGNENPAQGFTINFVCDDNVKVYVYETQDMDGDGALSTTAYSRDGDSGELLNDGNGQVNFKLVFADGYELANIDITEGYNNLKGSADTGVENGYRITKITDDLTVTITSQLKGTEEDYSQGYKVTFVCDEHVSVLVYKTQDMNGDGEATNIAYSRDSGTGMLTLTDGQVNFVLVFDEGYELAGLNITEGYKNLKDSADTGVENGYRITKITDDLTVTVTSQLKGTEEDYSQGYKITFICDEHVTVLVYKTQDMNGDGEATNIAYSRDSGTGILTLTDGQVNFVLVFDEGYELASIDITEGYKNLKDSSETGVENGYRITKISADIIVTITTTTIA